MAALQRSPQRARKPVPRSARPATTPGGERSEKPSTAPRRRAVRVVVQLLLVVAPASAAAVLTARSSLVRAFLDFGAGVLALVSLSAAVLWGLTATDRRIAYSDHRLVAQGVHRILAVAGLGFLALHVWIKVTESHVSALAAALPFADDQQPVLVALGTLAGYGFVLVAVTGAARSAFVSPRRALWWRALHQLSYAAWCAALLHGLKSGRVAASWASIAYVVCLVGVAAVLLLRLLPRGRTGSPAGGAGRPAPAPPRPSARIPTPPGYTPPSAPSPGPVPQDGAP